MPAIKIASFFLKSMQFNKRFYVTITFCINLQGKHIKNGLQSKFYSKIIDNLINSRDRFLQQFPSFKRESTSFKKGKFKLELIYNSIWQREKLLAFLSILY